MHTTKWKKSISGYILYDFDSRCPSSPFFIEPCLTFKAEFSDPSLHSHAIDPCIPPLGQLQHWFFLLDLTSLRQGLSLSLLCTYRRYIVSTEYVLRNKSLNDSYHQYLLVILLYMVTWLFTEKLNKTLVLILDFYHLLFSTICSYSFFVFKKYS